MFRWLLLVPFFAFWVPVGVAETIWIEAENTTDTTIEKDDWYHNANPSILSGGKWVSHFGETVGTARYAFHSSKAASHLLWLRANPKQTTLRYKLNDRSWQTVTTFSSATDLINVAGDKKNDFRYLAWINAGQQPLISGVNTIEFEFTSKDKNHGALDCFTFSLDPEYIPTKTKKVGFAQSIYPLPLLDEKNFDGWLKFVEPSATEMMWRTHVRWHTSLADAVVEAKRLRRPILLWTMNGHPSGET